MKKLVTLFAFCSVMLVQSQAFTGSGDQKFQVGLNAQEHATGLNVSYDHGLGENISLGISSTYALGVEEALNAEFTDRFDIKGRFNANLSNVLNISTKFDFYPGLSFSTKNFGGHTGMRYFFTNGFGLYGEVLFPLAKYNTDELTPAETLHNQVSFNIGASFNFM